MLDLIFRKTYGWHKKADVITLGTFSKLTGLSRSHIQRSLSVLLKMNLIIKGVPKDGYSVPKDGYRLPNVYGIQKDFEKWGCTQRRGLYPKMGTKVYPKMGYNKKKRKENYSELETPYKLAKYLSTKVLENFPKIKKPDLQKWSHHIDLMIRIDKRDPNDIGCVIEWCQKDNFWKSNILSTESLRKGFDKIQAKMGGLHG